MTIVLDAVGTDLGLLDSFETFPPAPYGIDRSLALTMPLGEPFSMDPAVINDVTSSTFVDAVFRGLVHLDSDLTVVPDLAESWEVDEAGVVYTFTLRDGITFHDGRPITAHDFKWSIERATSLEPESYSVPLYLGDIVGVQEKLAGEANEVAGYEALDDRTVRITIDAPKAYFLAKLTYPSGHVVDRLTVESGGEEWWREPINGSGPYVLERWDEEEVVILKRFEGFHDAYPGPEYVISPVVPIAGASAFDMYRTEAWDVLTIAPATVELVRFDAELFPQMREYEQPISAYVQFDTTRPPFNDAQVRRAFAMAVDTTALIDEVYGGNATPATGLLPPGFPAFNDSLSGIPFDPEGARDLLASTLDTDSMEILFTATDRDGEPSALVQFLLDSWTEVLGIEVAPHLLDPDAYYYEGDELWEHLRVFGWVADYPDPENFLDLLFHSESAYSRFTSGEYDALVEKARTEVDQTTRFSLYEQAEEILVDTVVMIPLLHFSDYALVRPHILDFEFNQLGGPRLSSVVIGPIGE